MTAETLTRINHALDNTRKGVVLRELFQKNDGLEFNLNGLQAEAIELQEAVFEAFAKDDVFSVASEIADVAIYLCKVCDAAGIDFGQILFDSSSNSSDIGDPYEITVEIVRVASALLQQKDQIDVNVLRSSSHAISKLLNQLSELAGLDLSEAIEMKNKRNSLKYDLYHSNNGYDPEEAVRIMRESWEHQGGDVRFSHLYLDVLADL